MGNKNTVLKNAIAALLAADASAGGRTTLKLFLYMILAAACAMFFGAIAIMSAASIAIGSVEDAVYSDLSKVPELETAVILGTGKMSSDGSEFRSLYTRRVEYAAALYLNGKVKKIIVSGAGGPEHAENSLVGDHVSSMREDLEYLGVRPEDITEDPAGYRTLDSVLRARDVYKAKSPIFVSQRDHAMRAVFQARQNGYEAFGFSQERPASPYETFMANWRESRSRVLALIDIFILKRGRQAPAEENARRNC